jgi:hypothetical protein
MSFGYTRFRAEGAPGRAWCTASAIAGTVRSFAPPSSRFARSSDKDKAAAKKELSEAISLIDKMAGKGIIPRNTASRYKSPT